MKYHSNESCILVGYMPRDVFLFLFVIKSGKWRLINKKNKFHEGSRFFEHGFEKWKMQNKALFSGGSRSFLQ